MSRYGINSIDKNIAYVNSPLDMFTHSYSEEEYGFLYESIEQYGENGRYSFTGGRPFIVFQSSGDIIRVKIFDKQYYFRGDPFKFLKILLRSFRHNYNRFPFNGGAVGYVGYDAVRLFEKIPDKNPDELKIPDIYLIFPSELIVFDHKYNTADIILHNGDNQRKEILAANLKKKLKDKPIYKRKQKITFVSNFDKGLFTKKVLVAKEYIKAGEIFQIVLSQRFESVLMKEPKEIYRALRIKNPSPYMYYLKFNDLHILGSSPETLVALNGHKARCVPIAGTRPRGTTQNEDKLLKDELLRDEKELAEHTMLVDLARNDLGRVCIPGSIRVKRLFDVEKFSKVMHIVSEITGRLKMDRSAFDLFRATFPAGTVSGAPKIRAMELIDELETVRRSVYAGAIGYFDFNGNMDFCIAIRTIIIKGKHVYLQGGAGIVADSNPENEYKEIENKVLALKAALEM